MPRIKATEPMKRVSRRAVLQGGIATGAALATAGYLPMPAIAQAVRRDTRGIEQTRLANGLDIVVVPDRRLPIVTHTLWYRIGGGDEGIHETGIAHFFEHLMFKGTDAFPGNAFDRYVSRYGGTQNATTGYDYTNYYQRLPKDHLPRLMEMEASRMRGLQLTDQQIATERGAVLEEKRGSETHDSYLFASGLAAVQYPGHRQGIPIIGLEEHIKGADRDALLAFYRRNYAPNNAILIVGGDVTTREVVALAEATYGKIEPSSDLPPRKRQALPPPSSRRYEFRSAKLAAISAQRVFRCPNVKAMPIADTLALQTLESLSQSAAYSSGAFRRLVYDRKVATYAGLGLALGLSTGTISFSVQAAQGVGLDAAEQALDEMIALQRKDLPDKALLGDVISQHRIGLMKDVSHWSAVSAIGNILTSGRPLDYYFDWRERLIQVTVDDLRRVIDTYLEDDSAVAAVALPQT